MKIDIIADDLSGREVLFVIVKAGRYEEGTAWLFFEDLKSVVLPARFGMFADLDWLVDFRVVLRRPRRIVPS